MIETGINAMLTWVFFGRTDAKAETPVLWPPDAKSWFIGKHYDAGRNCGQEENGTTEDEMAGWHHWLDGRESEWAPGVGDGRGDLACCNSWGRKESDMTEWLNWAELTAVIIIIVIILLIKAIVASGEGREGRGQTYSFICKEIWLHVNTHSPWV